MSGRYDEVIETLGPEDGEFFAQHYDVTPDGNFEGHNILNRLKPLPRSDRRRSTACGVARKTARRARQRACARASTTRSWPIGTG